MIIHRKIISRVKAIQESKGGKKRLYLTSVNAIHFIFKSSLRDDLSQYLDMRHLFVHAVLWGGVELRKLKCEFPPSKHSFRFTSKVIFHYFKGN